MTPTAYLLALASYVVLGLVFKSAVLNWIVGPLYPLAVLYLLPRLLRRPGGGDEEGGAER